MEHRIKITKNDPVLVFGGEFTPRAYDGKYIHGFYRDVNSNGRPGDMRWWSYTPGELADDVQRLDGKEHTCTWEN